jgi:hypothetical protein
MRNSITSVLLALPLAAALLAIPACQKTEEAAPAPAPEAVTASDRLRFKELGFDVSDLRKVGPDFLVEGDMIITPQALKAMGDPVVVNGPRGEQYRTYNLVRSPQVITVRGANLSTRVSQALDLALANYNNLGLGLTFRRVTTGGLIVVRESGSGAGGVAGFPPGNGSPYGSVTIYGGTRNYSLDVCEHVVTHEIGHCVGLRHTDWFNRSYSCNSGGTEGQGSSGAVHIPGTPTGFDANSIMNACFTDNETGEFSRYDVTALNYLY